MTYYTNINYIINMLFDFVDNKRIKGQYFTQYNSFQNDGFLEWAEQFNLKN